MEQNNFKCSGDCIKCHPNQRAYCASQFTYNTMRMVESMQQTVVTMQGTIENMSAKIEALQDEKVEIFNPSEEENSEIPKNQEMAQSGDGADE